METAQAYHGYPVSRFPLDGRESLVVRPHTAAPGQPWVWRAEFFGAFDQVDRAMLARGWHVAYHRVSDLYGCPRAIGWMHDFHMAAVRDYALSEKPAIFGFSRGGLYACNYAARYPGQVLALYLDAPVLDIRSWPGALGASDTKDAALWRDCLRCWGLDEQSARTFAGNPLDNAEALAHAGVPILMVAGLADTVVPYDENGRPFAARYRAAGGDITCIEKPGCGHHPHSLDDPTPVVRWLLERQAGHGK